MSTNGMRYDNVSTKNVHNAPKWFIYVELNRTQIPISKCLLALHECGLMKTICWINWICTKKMSIIEQCVILAAQKRRENQTINKNKNYSTNWLLECRQFFPSTKNDIQPRSFVWQRAMPHSVPGSCFTLFLFTISFIEME